MFDGRLSRNLRSGPGTQIEYYTRQDGQGNVEAQFQYLFDPLGRRIEKRNELTGQSEIYSYRDDDVTADFAREGNGPFTLTATYVQDLGIDAKVIKVDAAGGQHNFLLDALSSVGATTDAAAVVVETNLMGAWGEMLAASGAPDPRVSGLAQRERNLESNLQFNRARAYDPSIGRFCQLDPIRGGRTVLAYVYSRNQPLILIDPSGMYFEYGYPEDFSGPLFAVWIPEDGRVSPSVLDYIDEVGLQRSLGRSPTSAYYLALRDHFVAQHRTILGNSLGLGAGSPTALALEFTNVTQGSAAALLQRESLAAGVAIATVESAVTVGRVAVEPFARSYDVSSLVLDQFYETNSPLISMSGQASEYEYIVQGHSLGQVVLSRLEDSATEALFVVVAARLNALATGGPDALVSTIDLEPGSLGVRTQPRTWAEQLTMSEARSGGGSRIMEGRIVDIRFPESTWAKMDVTHYLPDAVGGGSITIHYWEYLPTGYRIGFKFKDP